MSGIAGIVHFDGRPVARGEIEAMTAAMDYRGPDGIRHWFTQDAALGHCMLRTTRESLEEQQPLLDEAHSTALVLDGTLDNADELRADLLALGVVPRNSSDAEIALQGFMQWGVGVFGRIHGDFAIAILRTDRRELILARDVMGTRPLHYRRRGLGIEFASDMVAMMALPGASNEPNLGMIAEFLSAQVVSRSDTVYASVQRLQAGHYGILAHDGRWIERPYWIPDTTTVRTHRSEAGYVEELSDILRKAVTRKARSLSDIAVLLSGGVDSPIVYGTLRDIGRMGGDVPSATAFSLVFPGQPCDESTYIDQIHAFWGAPSGHKVPGWIAPVEYYDAQAHRYRNLPDSPNGAMSHPLKKEIQRLGHRVVLTGCGGDEFFCGRDEIYIDLLLKGNVGGFLSLMKKDERNIADVLRSLISIGVHTMPSAHRMLRMLKSRSHKRPLGWIDHSLIRGVDLHERLRSVPSWFPDRYSSNENKALFGFAFNGWMSQNAEMVNLTYAECGLEIRHPMWSREVIEFSLSLPIGQRWWGDQDKQILRRAGRTLVPPSLQARNDKTTFNDVFLGLFRQEDFHSRLRQLPQALGGWLDPGGFPLLVARAEQAVKNPSKGTGALWPIWMAFAVDAWHHPR